MNFKKLVLKIHLILGLVSGIVVVILGITGCLLAFEVEIRKITEPFQQVKAQAIPMLPPAQLQSIAEKHLYSKHALGIEYPGNNKAAVALYYDKDNYERLYLNPYNGQVLRHKNMKNDFFRIVLDGHYNLWLPKKIGKPIAASATLIFLILMITGLILWWPKNKAAKKQRFTIKWNARWRRRNYDLHNVLGFYMTWIAIFIAITGLVFGFEWFAKTVYFVSSGGQTMEDHRHPVSDTTQPMYSGNMVNQLWLQHLKQKKNNESIAVYFAPLPTDPIEVIINHRPGTYYNSDYYHYDQYSGKELHASGSYAGQFANAVAADKIVRMNYDIHVGAIWGLPGKLMAFFASLIAASLPVSGCIIWYGKQKKRKKNTPLTIKHIHGPHNNFIAEQV